MPPAMEENEVDGEVLLANLHRILRSIRQSKITAEPDDETSEVVRWRAREGRLRSGHLVHPETPYCTPC